MSGLNIVIYFRSFWFENLVHILLLLYHRFYRRNENGHLVNAPYVDNSYQWAGGGFMSTAEDLVQFGNSMLYAKQMDHNRNTAGLATFLIDTEAIIKKSKLITLLAQLFDPLTHTVIGVCVLGLF